jgi:hypothetical protein
MHHLDHAARPMRITLLENGLAQGQPQLRQFNGTAQVVGDTRDISLCGRRLHDAGSKKSRKLKERVRDDSTGSKRRQ